MLDQFQIRIDLITLSFCREESKLKALALLQQRLGEVVDHADEKEERQVGREETAPEKGQFFILVLVLRSGLETCFCLSKD